MIVCVSPNPALDRSVAVEHFTPGQVFRAQSTLEAAGGKGINVVRAISILGGDGLGMGFLGGNTGKRIVSLCDSEGLKGSWTWIDGETRTCTIVADVATGVATVINESGPLVSQADWLRLHEDVLRESQSSDMICFSGSLPPGSSTDWYVSLIADVTRQGKPLWVDTSGSSLRAVIGLPAIGIKVNGEEAGAILNRVVDDPASALGAAAEIQRGGPDRVVITLGAKGAIMLTPEGRWYAHPPVIKVLDAVGSGDSFLAGLAYGLTSGQDGARSLQYAVAAGAANATTIGGGSFPRETFQQLLNDTSISML